MISLIDYADSDSDEALSPKFKRRSIEGKRDAPDGITRRRDTEIPEAPSSSDERNSPKVESVGGVKDRSPWMSEGEADSRITDEEHERDEPPPPPPHRFLHSPTPSSRGGTPSVKGLLNVPSTASLVSYSANEQQMQPSPIQNIQPECEQTNNRPESTEPVSPGVKNHSPNKDIEQAEKEKDNPGEGVDNMEHEVVDDVAEEQIAVMGPDSPDVAPQVSIPPEPQTKCSERLEEQFRKHFEKKDNGMDFNAAILKRKDFRNPRMYDKLIEHFGIDELGSNFPKHIYNPHGFKPLDYYDKIGEAQKKIMERLEKEKEQAQSKEIHKLASNAAARKSKWDRAK